MRIEHASLLQVRTGRHGQKVLIENDVLDVVRQLQEISPDLFVEYIEQGNYFAVGEHCKDGVERLVTTANQLDSRLVEHVRMIGSESWNRELGTQMDRMEDQVTRDKQHSLAERVGEIGERLHHALRKDKEVKNRIWVPGYAKDRE